MDFDYVTFDTAFPWFFPTVAAIFGAMVGSFLNVVILRVPRVESIVHPGSHCACGQPIAWYDNLPVLSWLILRGKARCCGRPYSIRYPLIEALTAILFWASWITHTPTAALAGCVLVSLLIAATFIDLDHMIIPDSFTIWGGVVGVLLSFLLPSLHGQTDAPLYIVGSARSGLEALLGLLIGSGVVLWIGLVAEAILRKEAMGFGDVKFVGMIGAFTGWEGAVFTMFGGAVVGTVWFILALGWQAVSGRKSAALHAETAEGEPTDLGFGAQVPFGPMLAIAAAIYWLGGERWFTAWLDQIRILW